VSFLPVKEKPRLVGIVSARKLMIVEDDENISFSPHARSSWR
jgi:hypothetical protein